MFIECSRQSIELLLIILRIFSPNKAIGNTPHLDKRSELSRNSSKNILHLSRLYSDRYVSDYILFFFGSRFSFENLLVKSLTVEICSGALEIIPICE